jgi:hypothetical protein
MIQHNGADRIWACRQSTSMGTSTRTDKTYAVMMVGALDHVKTEDSAAAVQVLASTWYLYHRTDVYKYLYAQ